MGITIVLWIIILYAYAYGYVLYKVKSNISTMSNMIVRFMEIVYGILILLLAFIFFLNFLSYINSDSSRKGCIARDSTCIFISPYKSHQANDVFAKYPVAYRNSKKLIQNVRDWADRELVWYEMKNETKDDEISYTFKGIKIRLLLFLDDFKIYIRICKENNRFLNIIVHAEARIGTKNSNDELNDAVKDFYDYLYENNGNIEQLYNYCLTKEELDDII